MRAAAGCFSHRHVFARRTPNYIYVIVTKTHLRAHQSQGAKGMGRGRSSPSQIRVQHGLNKLRFPRISRAKRLPWTALMPRRKDYRAYWCGFIRCFFCAVWNNGTTFQRWAIFTQFLLLAGIPGAIFAPWLEITYKTGNHLERVRPTFALIDGNGNNKLEFTELSNFFKDLNQVFFGSYFRNDAELARSLLIDRDSPCLPAALQALQGLSLIHI